ncbi:MAG: DNA alkylation repair protein [Verrucomicrobiota bacterium]|nr:DNA alkylation repair protein [Verrucomicrobiota bacterium]
MIRNIRSELRRRASRKKAGILRRFFKTGPGEYGEGDVFIGVQAPDIRRVVLRFKDAPISVAGRLLRSPIHEERLLALLLLSCRFERGAEPERRRIFDLYLANTSGINNWDLVDLSAPAIVGGWLLDRSRNPLYRLARASRIWERRIAIVATRAFIRRGDHRDTLGIAKILLNDDEALIHKAVGWMLREVGKRDRDAEEKFLKLCYADMPRIMLRYAIERFPAARRREYLLGRI